LTKLAAHTAGSRWHTSRDHRCWTVNRRSFSYFAPLQPKISLARAIAITHSGCHPDTIIVV